MTHRKVSPNLHLDDTSASYDLGSLSDDAILKRAAAILEARCVREGDVLSNPTDARRAVQLRTATLEHDKLGEGYIASQDDVTAVLAFPVEVSFGKCGNTSLTGDGREDAQTATIRVSNRSAGTAKPSSSRVATSTRVAADAAL